MAARLALRRANEVWNVDITYVPTAEGWLYLAGVMDQWSRKIVGWAMDSNLQTSLLANALKMALLQRHPKRALLHHSDRGVQYASKDYRLLLEDHKIEPSMSRKANCYDNVTTPVMDDGLVFDSATVEAADIREGNEHGGIRINLMSKLGTAEVPVQIDVGAGDIVTSAPEMITFPSLLEFPAARIRSYPAYTVVAEKFEAMVALGATNTRLKDFYDLWFLSRRFEFDKATLRKAIEATFAPTSDKNPRIPRSI